MMLGRIHVLKDIDESANENDKRYFEKISRASFFIPIQNNKKQVIAAEVYEKPIHNSVMIDTDEKRLWVKCSKFDNIRVGWLQLSKIKLDNTEFVIELIKKKHEYVLRLPEERKRKKQEEEFKKALRKKRMKKTEVPKYLQWSAAHPFSGGRFTPK